MIDKKTLIAAIEAATVRKTVKVPATCYYSRPGDTDDDTIVYIDPQQLISELESLFDA